jgi:hypothetical protein
MVARNGTARRRPHGLVVGGTPPVLLRGSVVGGLPVVGVSVVLGGSTPLSAVGRSGAEAKVLGRGRDALRLHVRRLRGVEITGRAVHG